MKEEAVPTETRWFTDTRMRILVAAETCSVVEGEAQQGNMPPLHVHRDHDEVFYVLRGRLSLHLPGSTVELGPGEAAVGPAGVPHTYRVESAEGATWVVTTTTGGFARFIAETSVPAEGEGYAPQERWPSPETLGAVAAQNGIELLGPPGLLP
jgi:quercetin dioxygenase-like cupin family protein